MCRPSTLHPARPSTKGCGGGLSAWIVLLLLLWTNKEAVRDDLRAHPQTVALALAQCSYAMQLYWYIVKCLIIRDMVQLFVTNYRNEAQPHPCMILPTWT